MMLVRAYLAPSPIEGLGVFSNDPIKAGDAIWRFDPRLDRLIDRSILDTADERIHAFIDRYCYEMPGYPDHFVLDADEGRFMNHSDTPNCDFTAPDVGYALVDIAPGTELTCNYRQFTTGELYFQPPRHRVSPDTLGNGHAG